MGSWCRLFVGSRGSLIAFGLALLAAAWPVAGWANDAFNNGPICTGQTLRLGTLKVGTAYSWTGPNGFTSTFQNPMIVDATPLNSGRYCVSVTIEDVTAPPVCTDAVVNPIPSTTASSNSPICAGATLQLNATPVAGGSYTWTGPNGFSSTLQNPTIVDAQPVNSGDYSVTVTVAGCTSGPSVTTVVVRPLPGVTAGNNGPICAGQTLELTASTVVGGTYAWTGPGDFTSSLQNPTIPNARPANSGVYSVTVTVEGCDSAPALTTAVVNAIPSITASNNGPICAGGTLELDATTVAGGSYSWTGPAGFASTLQNPSIPNAQPANSGEYSVTVTLPGCGPSEPARTTAVVNAIPSITASNNGPICAGQTLELGATTVAGGSYSWTGPAGFASTLQNPSIPNAQPANAGEYSVMVTVAGCVSAPARTTAVVNPFPSVTASNNSPICAGQTLELNATTVAGGSYSWTGPAGFTSTLQNPGIVSAQPANSGEYSVRVTVAGCTSPPSFTTARVNAVPSVTAGNGGPICAGQTLQLNATTVTGGSYRWTGPGDFTSTEQNPEIANAQPAQSGLYCVTVTLEGCTSTPSCTETTVQPLPAVVAANNGPVALGGAIQLSVTTSPGATCRWTGPGGFTSTEMNPTIPDARIADAGRYCVTCTLDGCSAESCTEVVVLGRPSVVATNNGPICAGDTLKLMATTVPGGSYSWTGPAEFSSTLQNPIIPNAQPVHSGEYTVIVTVDFVPSLPAVTTAIVNELPSSAITASRNPICAGDSATLCGPDLPNLDYRWSPGGESTRCISVGAAGAYTLTVKDRLTGCSSTSSLELGVTARPQCLITASREGGCSGQPIELCGPDVAGLAYRWSPGGETSRCITATQAGTYILVVTDAASGCSSEPCTFVLGAGAAPTCAIKVKPEGPLCEGEQADLCGPVGSGLSYRWSTGATTRCIETKEPGVFTLTVTDAVSGCASTCSTTVEASPMVCSITGPDQLLEGTKGQLCGPEGDFEYEWSNDKTTRCITVGPGTYTLTVFDKESKCKGSTCKFTIRKIPCECETGYSDDRFRGQSALELVLPSRCSNRDSLLRLYYGADEALALGVRRIVIKDVGGTSAFDYPVSPSPEDPGCVRMPAVGAMGTSGDQDATDRYGRPIYPALFVSDITDDPENRSGDWQQGGVGIPPHKVCGVWKSMVKTVDRTTSPPVITITADRDPKEENGWDLGPGSDDPHRDLDSHEFGAEVAWNVHRLGLTPGRIYRFYVMLRRGKSSASGYAAQSCVHIQIPRNLTVSSEPWIGSAAPVAGGVEQESASSLARSTVQSAPLQFEVLQNQPNPFKGETTIGFTLPERSRISIRVYTILGQEIATPVDGELDAGRRSFSWRAVDRSGRPLAPGVYVYRMQAQGLRSGVYRYARKMILIQ